VADGIPGRQIESQILEVGVGGQTAQIRLTKLHQYSVRACGVPRVFEVPLVSSIFCKRARTAYYTPMEYTKMCRPSWRHRHSWATHGRWACPTRSDLAIVTGVAANPAAGDVIEGTGGARKVRFAGKGKGKSGGYRVITFFAGTDIPVFLLNIFAKNEKTDLTPRERRVFKNVLSDIVKTYRPTRKSR
jgi:hypothetical protein